MATDRWHRIALLAILAVLAVGALSACVDQVPTSPSANVIVVQSVLDAGTPDQYVIVQTTDGLSLHQRAFAGATVVLTLPDGSQMTAAQQDGVTIESTASGVPPITTVYKFALGAAGLSLVPGGRYQLRVALPDGRVVTGSTTVPTAKPAVPAVLPQSFDHASDSLVLSWPRVAGAASYQIDIQSLNADFRVFTDTAVVLNGKTQNSDDGVAFRPGLTQQLVVSAVDANYYDYYRRDSDPYTGVGVINHLTGGIGLFGSIVELDARTLVVR